MKITKSIEKLMALALVVTVTALAGCGDAEKAAAPKEKTAEPVAKETKKPDSAAADKAAADKAAAA